METQTDKVTQFDDDGDIKSTVKQLPRQVEIGSDGLVLAPAVHQVAGHGQTDGRPGPLVDESGRLFLKPMNEGDYRADREIAFYEKLKLDESVPSHVKAFFPMFIGTRPVPSLDGNGFIRHGVMENLTYGFKNPSVCDFKIGYRTWYPEASEKYKAKSLAKDQKTTSGAIGFRISGMQVYDAAAEFVWKPERKWLRDMSVETIRPCMERFVSSNPFMDNPDASRATSVYSVALQRLQELERWFCTQTAYLFTSSSVLLIYESLPTAAGESSADGSWNVAVKLVDFAHVTEAYVIDSWDRRKQSANGQVAQLDEEKLDLK